MKEPVLVIMAAGLGSRYGGLKQIDPVDNEGHIIIDFSIYDAIKAGFKKVLFIIKKENEKEFKECIGNRVSPFIETDFVYQELTDIPEGYSVPNGRKKPWGTGHAIMCCRHKIDGPFAVINADDYYGRDAFFELYQYLISTRDDGKYRYAMVGYLLQNTLTDHGFVSRGVCEVRNDMLAGISERTHIEKRGDYAVYLDDEMNQYIEIPKDSPVSMNMWGFTESILEELYIRFGRFLKNNLAKNPEKCEYFLPTVVGELVDEGKATVKVLRSIDRWYGITYKEDKEFVIDAIQDLKDKNVYPRHLWK